jgi:hypothetical protein
MIKPGDIVKLNPNWNFDRYSLNMTANFKRSDGSIGWEFRITAWSRDDNLYYGVMVEDVLVKETFEEMPPEALIFIRPGTVTFKPIKIEEVTDELIDDGWIYAHVPSGERPQGEFVRVNDIARPHPGDEWFDPITEWSIYHSSESWKETIDSGYLYRLYWS